MNKKLLLVLLVASFLLKQLVWLTVIPLWHFPDEEQHFSHTAFYAEKGYFPTLKVVDQQGGKTIKRLNIKEDVSREINQSSEILGTKRDSRGLNKFTYHPEYRLPYSKSQTGIFEEEIKALNTPENRQTMVKREAARYGPAYYFITGLAYRAVYPDNLMVRVLASRLPSVFLAGLMVLVVWLISCLVFKSRLMRLALTSLVAFQPMFSFVSAGVNSDNLFNLIFTLILYACLKVFLVGQQGGKGRLERLGWLGVLAALITLGFYTKTQIIISLPIVLLAAGLFWLTIKDKGRKRKLALAGIVGLVGLGLILAKLGVSIPEYDPSAPSKLKESFFQYIFWHLRHTIAETIPWYWGVFNWLGVTLPRWVNRVQARLLILALLGNLIYFYRQLKNGRLASERNLRIIFLFGSALIYYAALISWDFFFRQTQGYSFGIQGRYFFPTIVCHMLLVLLGLASLVPRAWPKIRRLVVKILVGWWLVFHFIGLTTATAAYYQFWPLPTFINQASQYKPAIVKGWGLVVVIIAGLVSCLAYLIIFSFLKAKSLLDEKKT